MAINENYIEYAIKAPLGSCMLEPDSIVIQSEEWYQVVTPSIKDVALNEVIISRIENTEVDQKIEEAFAKYNEFKLPFKWSIGPMSNDLIEEKIQNKAQDMWFFRGMFIETEKQITYSKSLEVERVGTHNFEDFLDVYLLGWGMENFRDFARTKFAQVTHPDSTQRYFIVRKSGQPIATAGTVFKDNYGYLVGAVVLPNSRGCGAYRALLNQRLSDLRENSRKIAVTQAREKTSAPILQQLKFHTAFKAKIYKFL